MVTPMVTPPLGGDLSLLLPRHGGQHHRIPSHEASCAAGRHQPAGTVCGVAMRGGGVGQVCYKGPELQLG